MSLALKADEMNSEMNNLQRFKCLTILPKPFFNFFSTEKKSPHNELKLQYQIGERVSLARNSFNFSQKLVDLWF